MSRLNTINIRYLQLLSFFGVVLCSFNVAADFSRSLERIQALKLEAELADARFLAPNLYQRATNNLTKLKDLHKKKPGSKKVAKLANVVQQEFTRARRSSELAKDLLAGVIAARQDAVAAKAIDFAPEEWSDSSKALLKLVSRVEKNKLPIVESAMSDAESKFKQAELVAIKRHYLNAAKQRIETALADKVDKFSPRLLSSAQSAVQEAELELTNNRYDTDKARFLAKRAKIDAGHAIRIANDAKKLKNKKASYEDLALEGEKPLLRVAESLDLSVALDDGVERPTMRIIDTIDELKKDSLALIERQREVEELRVEIEQLNTRLGEQSNKLDEQAAFRKKLAEAEAIFDQEAARVYRQGNTIRVSAYGFNFPPGEAALQSDQSTLLKKMMQVIRLFPGSSIVIEGHTDSHGSDASNLLLSQERAEAVSHYLRERKDKLKFSKLEMIGYGESSPVANNETTSGREKNRRIELVIDGIK